VNENNFGVTLKLQKAFDIMLIQQSKNLFSLLISVAVIFTTTPSFSKTTPNLIKSDLTELGVKIVVNKEKLRQIWSKFIIIECEGKAKLNHDEKFLDVIETVNDNLAEIVSLLDHESESIITIPHIMERYKSFFSNLRIESINHTKKLINTSFESLNYIYSESEYKGTLSTIGDPRKDILSALELLDKSILILQPIKERK
jgi:hypothetical protein